MATNKRQSADNRRAGSQQSAGRYQTGRQKLDKQQTENRQTVDRQLTECSKIANFRQQTVKSREADIRQLYNI